MAVIKDLPTRVVHADTIQVIHLNCLRVRLHTGFGQSLVKRIIVEGLDHETIPSRFRQQAVKAMVVVVGGKALLVHANDALEDGILVGRVYLNARVYDAPPGVLHVPYGLDQPLLEVGSFFRWLQERQFDIGAVKDVLNGRYHAAVPEGARGPD